MPDLEKIRKEYADKDLEERKQWYTSVALAYEKTRPFYPQKLIDRAIEIAQLPPKATILEVGCGPGKATLAFAPLGFNMVCIEPNPQFCQLATQNCQPYPNVEIHNNTFEDWDLSPNTFDAVLAANSWHWISPEISCQKADKALKNNGSLILLWNAPFQSQEGVYNVLDEVYKKYAPSIQWYESKKGHQEGLKKMGESMIKLECFKDLVSEELVFDLIYDVDDYLMLLSSLSPYIALDLEDKNTLFQELKQKIEHHFNGKIKLSYLSMLQIARKISYF